MTSYSTKIYNISSWIDAPFGNIPLKVQIQRYRCLKLDIFRFIFRQWVLEECILPSFNVWPHIPRKYTIFQVGLTIQLAIFLSKYKYKDTGVWKLTYWVFMFRQSADEEWVLPSHYVGAHTVKYYIKFQVGLTLHLAIFPLKSIHYVGAHTVKKYIKFQVGLTLHLAIFPLKSKYKDTDVWNLTYSVWFFGNRLLKNEFCQVLMFDLVVYDNILYFKLDWQSN